MAKYVTFHALQTFYAGLKTKLSGKVNIEEGKGLSEVNVTQTMVDGWNDSERNVVVGINVKKGLDDVSPTSATIDEETRIATIIVPSKFSDLANDMTEGETALLTQAFYTTTIAPAIANAADGKLIMKIVQALPEVTDLDPKTIYLVPKTTADGESNIYDEYIVVVEGEGSSEVKRAERIGDTTIDLSEYVKNSDIVAVTDEEIIDMMAEIDAE